MLTVLERLTEACHSNPSIIYDKVNAIAMHSLQVLCETFDTATVRNIQVVKLDLTQPTVSLQCLCLLQLYILLRLVTAVSPRPLSRAVRYRRKGPLFAGDVGY